MKLILILLCSISILFSRTVILEDEKIETSNGLIFYILTLCKDGYQYTGYNKSETLDFKIIQDFEEDTKNKISTIKCQMDFKHESQLDK